MNPDRNLYERPGSYNAQNTTNVTRNLSKDELQVWNNCMNRSLYKAGLPFAVVSEFVMMWKAVREKKPIFSLKRIFFAAPLNCLFGMFLYSPKCFSELKTRYDENEKRRAEGIVSHEIMGAQGASTSRTDENPYQSNLDYDPSNSFSPLSWDMASSDNLNLSDSNTNEKPVQAKPEVTYEQLRQMNRDNYRKMSLARANEPYTFSSNTPELKTEPPKEIVKPKRKNKYGDEIE